MAITNKDPFAENMLAAIKKGMQEELNKVAEPIMAKALEEIQVALRRRMGAMTIGLLERSFDMQRLGDRLVISVVVKEPKS